MWILTTFSQGVLLLYLCIFGSLRISTNLAKYSIACGTRAHYLQGISCHCGRMTDVTRYIRIEKTAFNKAQLRPRTPHFAPLPLVMKEA